MPLNRSIVFLTISEGLAIPGVVSVFYEVFKEGSDFQTFWKTGVSSVKCYWYLSCEGLWTYKMPCRVACLCGHGGSVCVLTNACCRCNKKNLTTAVLIFVWILMLFSISGTNLRKFDQRQDLDIFFLCQLSLSTVRKLFLEVACSSWLFKTTMMSRKETEPPFRPSELLSGSGPRFTATKVQE